MTFVLGINAYHGDASACLRKDGALIAAAEEERFRRIKHWAGFPSEAIRFCLSEGKVALADLDHVAINRDPQANLLKKIGYTLMKRPDLGLVMERIRNAKKWISVEQALEQAFRGRNFLGRCIISNTTWPISPPPFMSRPSRRHWWFRWMASGIPPVPPGGWEEAPG